MGKLRWYKRDPNAALVGMRVLSCEERGAYNTVLDLIYAHDGKVIDDDRYLAGECALHVRSWRRIKNRLLDLKKIYIEDGHVKNFRADNEVALGLSKVESARNAGLASAAKRKGDDSNSNDIAATDVGTVVQPNTSTSRIRKKDAALRAQGELIPTPPNAETDLFRRGKEILGKNAGGFIREILRAKGENIPLARAAIETAATKENPREYLGAIVRNRDPPERTVDPRL